MIDSITVNELAHLLNGTIVGNSNLVCTGVASLGEAQKGDITFMVSGKYAKQWENSKASIGIIQKDIQMPKNDNVERALLQVEDADVAIASVLGLFKTPINKPQKGIHATAVIASSAMLGEGVAVGPNVVIEGNVILGDETVVCGGSHVGRDSKIGCRTMLRPGVTIEHECVIGDDCLLHAHVVIGTDGFGYRPNASKTGLTKMPHIGNVCIGNKVEIGANSCIDRGKFSSTKIGNGTKMDNLVQIGHNVKIGDNCVIAAECGIGGSVIIGDWVQIGAQVGIAPHCRVGNGAKVGAKSGLMHDVPPGEEWLGVPAARAKDTLRQWAINRKMPSLAKQFGVLKDD